MKILHKILAFFVFLICYNSCAFGLEKFFYHGSSTDGIERLEPRLRYTPAEEFNSPSGIYASDLPAFAAAHSFPWSSDEGIDLYVDRDIVIMEIPLSILPRLQKPIHIYVVDGNLFSLVESESTGHTFRRTEAVDCLEKISFPSVQEAIEHFGGRVILKDNP